MISLDNLRPFNWLLPTMVGYFIVSTVLAYVTGLPGLQAAFESDMLIVNAGVSGVTVLTMFLFSKPSRWQVVAFFLAYVFGAYFLFDLNMVRASVFPGVIPLAIGPGFVFSVPLLVGLMIYNIRPSVPSDLLVIRQLLVLGVAFVFLYSVSSITLLGLTVFFNPKVLDGRVYLVDLSLGFSPSVAVAALVRKYPLAEMYLRFSYLFSYYAFVLIYCLQVVSVGDRKRWHVVSVWFVISVAGLVVYHIFPVMGPLYYFGNLFPSGVPPAELIDENAVLAPTHFRNGVPSLHFGWAFAVFLISLSMRRFWVKALCGVWVVSIVMATLALGEHYLIDLVIAVPFVLMIMSLLFLDVPWSRPGRRLIFLSSAGIYLIWMVLLLWFYRFLINFSALTISLVGVTVAFGVWGAFLISRPELPSSLQHVELSTEFSES